MQLPEKATQPTMYFIGVTTARSSIMKLFPLWADELHLTNAKIVGIDMVIHANPQDYYDVVEFIKNDPLSRGALVTTHKIDLLSASRELFEYLDSYASLFGEVSSISKNEGKLEGYAKDPISSGLAMEAFIPRGFWRDHRGDAFIMGAGGSAIAIGSYLMRKEHGDDIPSRIIVSNRSQPRLDAIQSIFDRLNPGISIDYHLTPEMSQNDRILQSVRPYSLIVNATGLGKDRPGSPLRSSAVFPRNCLVWELNYRGDLGFLHHALAQRETQNLHVEDGWVYFIHGWTQVISEVFHIDVPASVLGRLERIANSIR